MADVIPIADMTMRASRIAERAHHGQVDKAGRPYIEHPRRVAGRVLGPFATTVAWLHDVVEDTTITLDDLRAAGFPERVVAAVDAITHRPNEPRTDYYARVLANVTAWVVKIADIEDNADPERLAMLDPETATRLRTKYAAAREALRRG